MSRASDRDRSNDRPQVDDKDHLTEDQEARLRELELLEELQLYQAELEAQNQELQQAQAELAASHEKYQDLYEYAPVGYFRLSSQGLIQEVNLTGASMLGVEPVRLTNAGFARFVHPDYHEAYFRSRRAGPLGSAGRGHPCEVVLKRRDGSTFEALLETSSIEEGEEEITRLVVIDISELKRLERRLRDQEAHLAHMSTHDLLTGVGNRALFRERALQTLQLAQRHNLKVGVLCLDLDAFSSINDALGHEVGDQVLQAVAQRLRESTRDSDTVARVAGDEFCVLLSYERGEKDLTVIADKINRAISKPVQAGDNQVMVSASVGISVFPNDGADIDQLLNNAQAAMRHNQRHRRNRYQFYAEEMRQPEERARGLVRGLARALSKARLEMAFLPQVDLRSGDVVCLETGLQWPGLAEPVLACEYLPCAQEAGLAPELSGWILDQAVESLLALRAEGCEDVPLALALPSWCFGEDWFLDKLRGLLDQHALDPRALEFEFTEEGLLEDTAVSGRIFDQVRDLAGHITIDNFGTGYSSMSYMQQVPISKLKIDRSFIEKVAGVSRDRKLVAGIIAFAEKLGLGVVAKGVTSTEQAVILAALGCDKVQGELVSPPVDRSTAIKLIQSGIPALPSAFEDVC